MKSHFNPSIQLTDEILRMRAIRFPNSGIAIEWPHGLNPKNFCTCMANGEVVVAGSPPMMEDFVVYFSRNYLCNITHVTWTMMSPQELFGGP